MIKQAQFIKSAAGREGWIDDQINEICFLGRSNVGKSSFINNLTNKKKLAKVSSTPGKTKLLNFFDINNGQFRIVDAPGYGFSKTTLAEKQQFARMMEDYLMNRSNLKGAVMLVDLRRKPNADDQQLYNFLKQLNLPVILIGTKLDKLKKNEINKNEKLIKNTLNYDQSDKFIKISNLNKGDLMPVYQGLIALAERK
ncbi:GTP-binding protein [Entomoplasma freundtii]|uniref:Probable GTP-binding protein EngB n=1 Tax=Entomoplasma freundtii TaxID=74700 RepID=A0A2K8NT65_9MOLU|nr:ribosome biogenesis GTP-binding protein YihA/YsxC [Entomoplasma freundtii]ATZ16368.1 GTP-binding protein [Entomoplasma freundtii]TDY56593.1 GTP-binding protein [Entomoplasma freundtii]